MPRREFSAAIRIEIIRRATGADGVIRCELCGMQVKTFHIDHKNPDALQIDKRRKLTADEGQLLCGGSGETCHGVKTKKDVKDIAKAKRREAKDLRTTVPAVKIKSTGFSPAPEKVRSDRQAKIDRNALPVLPRRVCGILIVD